MCGSELRFLPEGVQRVATLLQAQGHAEMPRMLDDAARTAQQAAHALGIAVGQIAKVVGVAPADINYIAYAGGGEASTAILANEVAAGVSSVSEFSEFVRAGQMRMLAVSSEKRLDVVADVPTLKESGVDVALLNWRGLVAPAGISDAERAALVDLLTKMNESQAWKDELTAQGWDNVFLTDGFDAYLEEENATITAVLKEIGLVK